MIEMQPNTKMLKMTCQADNQLIPHKKYILYMEKMYYLLIFLLISGILRILLKICYEKKKKIHILEVKVVCCWQT